MNKRHFKAGVFCLLSNQTPEKKTLSSEAAKRIECEVESAFNYFMRNIVCIFQQNRSKFSTVAFQCTTKKRKCADN